MPSHVITIRPSMINIELQLLAILISVLFWEQLILPGLFLASMSISGAGLGKLRPREDERVVEKGAASSSSSSYRL